jgi:hypothetical protein
MCASLREGLDARDNEMRLVDVENPSCDRYSVRLEDRVKGRSEGVAVLVLVLVDRVAVSNAHAGLVDRLSGMDSSIVPFRPFEGRESTSRTWVSGPWRSHCSTWSDLTEPATDRVSDAMLWESLDMELRAVLLPRSLDREVMGRTT